MHSKVFIVGALSPDPGGVVFNNRVTVCSLLQRQKQVVFYNYRRGQSMISHAGIEIVGWYKFIYELVKEKPRIVWVHTSTISRFLLYYPALMISCIAASSRLRIVLHSGAANISLLTVLPKVEIFLLDRNLYKRYRDRNAVYSYAEAFDQELHEYLSAEFQAVRRQGDVQRRLDIDRPYIITTGYINETYNFNELIHAYRRDMTSDVLLVIVSYGEVRSNEYSNEFYKLVSVPGVLHFRGLSRGDFLELLAGSNCLIRATRWDSYGIAMYEAHQFGIPVFASRIENYRPEFAELFDLGRLSESGLLQIVKEKAGFDLA